jgi:hypothetical protein
MIGFPGLASRTGLVNGNLTLSDGSTGNAILKGEFDAVGWFLFFLKIPANTAPTVVTREAIVTRISTEVDPDLGSIPTPFEVFRTRHIDRKRWGATTYWEQQLPVSGQPPHTFDFSWRAGAPVGSTEIANARERFFSPFVAPDPNTYREVRSVPDAFSFLDGAPGTTSGLATTFSASYITDPELVFFPVELKQGQYLRITSRKYDEQAVTYTGTAYTSPNLVDTVPTSGPSVSEYEIAGGFPLEAWMFRV